MILEVWRFRFRWSWLHRSERKSGIFRQNPIFRAKMSKKPLFEFYSTQKNYFEPQKIFGEAKWQFAFVLIYRICIYSIFFNIGRVSGRSGRSADIFVLRLHIAIWCHESVPERKRSVPASFWWARHLHILIIDDFTTKWNYRFEFRLQIRKIS